jgi:hypothetical protein
VAKWWDDDPREPFFLELTDRTNIGVDLNAPQVGSNGRPHHSYALVPLMRPPSVVLHYDKSRQAITSWSRTIGLPYEDQVIWGARGMRARRAGEQPFPRPGWRVPLDGPFTIAGPVTLDELRRHQAEIEAIFDELAQRIGRQSPHTPFERSANRPLRMVEVYLAKVPRQFLMLFPILADVVDQFDHQPFSSTIKPAPTPGTRPPTHDIGQDYVHADEEPSTGQRTPFNVDPDVVDRGTAAHAKTQNALATWLRSQGLRPRSPASSDPQYDTACRVGAKILIAEVKSLTDLNEERQLRLGLGQLLRYAQLMPEGATVVPALVVERAPVDETWTGLCEGLGIWLTWPPDFPGLNAAFG